MKRSLKIAFLAGGSALALSACGGGGGSAPPGGGGGGTVTVQSNFGTTFAQLFERSPDADPPIDPPDNAIIPISLSSEPLDF